MLPSSSYSATPIREPPSHTSPLMIVRSRIALMVLPSDSESSRPWILSSQSSHTSITALWSNCFGYQRWCLDVGTPAAPHCSHTPVSWIFCWSRLRIRVFSAEFGVMIFVQIVRWLFFQTTSTGCHISGRRMVFSLAESNCVRTYNNVFYPYCSSPCVTKRAGIGSPSYPSVCNILCVVNGI